MKHRKEEPVKISVIVPVYNTEKYLRDCLDSALGQSLREIELVCVEGGSKDSSLKILQDYADRDGRVRIIKQPEHGGPGDARNRGLDAARGKYIHFLDSDDILLEGALADFYELVSSHKLDGLMFNEEHSFASEEVKEEMKDLTFGLDVDESMAGRGVMSGEDYFVMLRPYETWPCQPGGYLWRREFLLQHGIKFPSKARYHEDNGFLMIAMVQAKRMMGTTRRGYCYRLREGSDMTSKGASHYARRCMGAFMCWREQMDFLQGHEFRSDLCRAVALRYAHTSLGQSTWLYRELASPVRQQVKFFNPADNFLFNQLVRRKEDGTDSKAASIAGKRLLVYGVGDHLADMLRWHPELSGCIERVFDKSPDKIGTVACGLNKMIESPEELRNLPAGTPVAVAAIRYYDEIVSDIQQINPSLVLSDIDSAYAALEYGDAGSVGSNSVVEKNTTLQSESLDDGWRQAFLEEISDGPRAWWGVNGTEEIRKHFAHTMNERRGDFYIDDDNSLSGCLQDGLPVCLPDVLSGKMAGLHIIVLSNDYEWIRDRLIGYGYMENADFAWGRRLLDNVEHTSSTEELPDAQVKSQMSDGGMIVYGDGAHLADMLSWHPELAEHIVRVIDRDANRAGTIANALPLNIEPISVVCSLPPGTVLAVAAIRYFDEIKREVGKLNPGVICKNIDEIWTDYI